MLNQNNSKNFLIQNKLKNLHKIKDSNKYWNITYAQGEYLSNLILEIKPKLVLEIGTSNGFSTIWISKNLDENSKLYTIEVNDERFDEAKQNFIDCEINNIIQIKGEIFEILNSDELENKSFDFIFIDAAHKFYIELIKKLLEKKNIIKDTLIVADNVISHPYMGTYINFMKETFQENELVDLGGGFLISSSLK